MKSKMYPFTAYNRTSYPEGSFIIKKNMSGKTPCSIEFDCERLKKMLVEGDQNNEVKEIAEFNDEQIKFLLHTITRNIIEINLTE